MLLFKNPLKSYEVFFIKKYIFWVYDTNLELRWFAGHLLNHDGVRVFTFGLGSDVHLHSSGAFGWTTQGLLVERCGAGHGSASGNNILVILSSIACNMQWNKTGHKKSKSQGESVEIWLLFSSF